MLKALIVDDERLVRSEIRKLVDWTEYGIEIVGEAENGRAALRFLEKHEIDLMISDLTMPGLSGMEFLAVVREQHPRVRVVVMTMHQEFDLVQQALRLGAVDYITKTQIERDNFGDLLHNIIKRLAGVPGEVCCEASQGTVLFAEPGVSFTREKPEGLLLEEGFYFSPAVSCPIPSGYLGFRFSELFGVPFRQLLARARECLNKDLFYVFTPSRRDYCFPLLAERQPLLSRRDGATALFKRMDWLIDDSMYHSVLQEIPQLWMTRDELTVFLYQPYLTCAPYLRLDPAVFFTETTGFLWWYQWREWLDGLREKTSKCLWPEDSQAFAMHKALAYIDRHYTTDIPLSQMLSLTGMSKSSFSACFKERTGQTFVNYLKVQRIEQAKRLLLETDQPISRISEQVGYPDERYFRRVFLEHTRCTPAQYRKASIKNEKGCMEIEKQ